MSIEAIVDKYGSMEGLTVDNGVIVSWPYAVAQPTESELDSLSSLFEAKTEYIRNRVKEYPSIEDQLDAIYHTGIDGWKATIKSIKDKYPNPT